MGSPKKRAERLLIEREMPLYGSARV